MSFYVVAIPGKQSILAKTRIEAVNHSRLHGGSCIRVFKSQNHAISFTNGDSKKVTVRKTVILPISKCTVIKIDAQLNKYKASIIDQTGKRTTMDGVSPNDVESVTITSIIAIYQLMGLVKDSIKLVCSDEMLNKMYKDKSRWINLKDDSGKYSRLISETFRMMSDRNIDLCANSPIGI